MTAAELLTTLRSRGLTVAADGDALVVRPRDLLTDELRAAIRANKRRLLDELTAPVDPDTERRRAKALAMLDANPGSRIAVVAETDPAIIGIAIRGLAYGELEVSAARYDGLALLAMLERYSAPVTIH